MVIVHLKTEIENYKIPPMGPMIHISYQICSGSNSKENATKMLDFALERLDIFESSNDYISILEYINLREYIWNCKGFNSCSFFLFFTIDYYNKSKC